MTLQEKVEQLAKNWRRPIALEYNNYSREWYVLHGRRRQQVPESNKPTAAEAIDAAQGYWNNLPEDERFPV